MGFMDKVKAAAQDVATQAKTATSQAQEKLEQSQIRKKMDEAARDLGYAVYRERTQGTPSGADADRLVADIQALEAQLTAGAAASAAPAEQAPVTHTDASPPPPTSSSEPTAGDFKL